MEANVGNISEVEEFFDVFVVGKLGTKGQDAIAMLESMGLKVKRWPEIIDISSWFHDKIRELGWFYEYEMGWFKGPTGKRFWPRLVIAELFGGIVLAEFLVKRFFPETKVLLWDDCQIIGKETKKQISRFCDCLLEGNFDGEILRDILK